MCVLLLWLYVTDAVLLVNHEIDSAYWKEWELFRLPGGIGFFLLLHFPVLLFILGGLVMVSRQAPSGPVFALVLSLGGIFAFVIHTYFLKAGRAEFNVPLSKLILAALLLVSLGQLGTALYVMIG